MAIKCSAAALWGDALVHSRELLCELRHVKGTKPPPRRAQDSAMPDVPFPLLSASFSVCTLATSGAFVVLHPLWQRKTECRRATPRDLVCV